MINRPVTLGHWATGAARTIVTNEVLNSELTATPADAIGVTTYDPGGGAPIATIYQQAYQVGGDFPDSDSGLNYLLNRSYSDDPDHTLSGYEYGPFEAVNFGTVDDPLFYTNFIANYWLNVKTWSVTGTIGTQTVSATIPAGTKVTDSITNPTRPNGGKRAAYEFGCLVNSPFVQGETQTQVSINSISSYTTPLSTYFQGPTPYLAMPQLNIEMTGGDSYAIQVATVGTTGSVSEDSNVTMLGQPMQTKLTNSPTGYSLSIEAHEWWTDEEWITESDWASQT
jgi:hypothetical protein